MTSIEFALCEYPYNKTNKITITRISKIKYYILSKKTLLCTQNHIKSYYNIDKTKKIKRNIKIEMYVGTLCEYFSNLKQYIYYIKYIMLNKL